MKKKDRKKMMYSNAKKRIEEHDKGFEPTVFKPPDGMEVFKFKETKNYKLDVMPYKVRRWNKFADPGSYHYERTFWVHRNVGPERKTRVCLKSFGPDERCPICEELAKMRRSGVDKDTIREMDQKERQLWYLIDRDHKEKNKIQVMECSHYKGFGEMLDNKIDAADEDSPHQTFYHLEDGQTVVVKAKEDTFTPPGGSPVKFFAPVNMEMVQRKQDYPSSVIKGLPDLMDLLVKMDYDDLKKEFTQEDADDKKSKKKGKKKPVEDDDEDQDDAEDEGDADDDGDDEDEDESDDDEGEGDSDPDDDDEGDDEDEDEDGDGEDDVDEDEDPAVSEGDRVSFKRKGKTLRGKVKSVEDDEAVVFVPDLKKRFTVPVDDLKIL